MRAKRVRVELVRTKKIFVEAAGLQDRWGFDMRRYRGKWKDRGS